REAPGFSRGVCHMPDMPDDPANPGSPAELSLLWCSPWYHRFITSVIYLAVALLCAGALVLVLLAWLLALLRGGRPPVTSILFSIPIPWMLFMWALLYLFLFVLYAAVTRLVGRTASVEVTREGVLTKPYWGRRAFVPWEDARLLE